MTTHKIVSLAEKPDIQHKGRSIDSQSFYFN